MKFILLFLGTVFLGFSCSCNSETTSNLSKIENDNLNKFVVNLLSIVESNNFDKFTDLIYNDSASHYEDTEITHVLEQYFQRIRTGIKDIKYVESNFTVVNIENSDYREKYIKDFIDNFDFNDDQVKNIFLLTIELSSPEGKIYSIHNKIIKSKDSLYGFELLFYKYTHHQLQGGALESPY